MGLNWIERQAAKLAWHRLEAKVNGLKRWAPVIGSLVLVSVVVLRVLGHTEAAGAVEGLANAVGLSAQSPVSLPELVAAAAAGTGVVLKILAQVRKSAAEPPTIR